MKHRIRGPLKRAVRDSMLGWRPENMQISTLIVQRVAVDMVNDLARLCIRHLPVFPLPAVAFRAIAQALRRMHCFMRFICPCDGGISRGWHDQSRCGWCDHLVPATLVFAGRQTVNLLLIGVQGVAMLVPHLIVPHAKFARRDGSIAIQARSPDDLARPSVLRRPVPLDSLVVHQAETVRRVLSSTAANSALHLSIVSKAIGNSWAVNCPRWLGQRIAMVEGLAVRQ